MLCQQGTLVEKPFRAVERHRDDMDRARSTSCELQYRLGEQGAERMRERGNTVIFEEMEHLPQIIVVDAVSGSTCKRRRCLLTG